MAIEQKEISKEKGLPRIAPRGGVGTSSVIESLFKIGAHFGYSKSRRHPSFVKYIFGSKKGVDIINLEKTSQALNAAKEFVRTSAQNKKEILLVGTKPEIKDIVREIAEEAEIPYVTFRWIGGTLTNFSQMQRRVNLLEDLRSKKEKGELSVYTKKEQIDIEEEISKLEKNFSGIEKIKKLPDMLLIIDPRHESTAVSEAKRLNIPIIALANSDSDLSDIAYPVPANDAALASVRFFVVEIVEAYKEGKKAREEEKEGKDQAEKNTKDEHAGTT